MAHEFVIYYHKTCPTSTKLLKILEEEKMLIDSD